MKTYEEVRAILSAIEASETLYAQITAEDIPSLKKLLKEDEAWLAARAIFALSRVDNPESTEVIMNAVKDKRSAVRVAIAHSANALKQPVATERILSALITDKDVGVRKFAIQSIPKTVSPELMEKIRSISQEDSHDYIKGISSEKIRSLKVR